MQDNDPYTLDIGIYFYWYEENPKSGEKHLSYWGQLCGGLHRLAYVRDELNGVRGIEDLDEALERLAYHMENYLVRVYELRERAAKLLKAATGYKGDIGQLKSRTTRHSVVNQLLVNEPDTAKQYLELLAALDDDIDLRNRNTHNTFLSLGYWSGYDIFDPHDSLVDLQPHTEEGKWLRQTLREEIEKTVERYVEKINHVNTVARVLLEKL